jgi:hypothetical protein
MDELCGLPVVDTTLHLELFVRVSDIMRRVLLPPHPDLPKLRAKLDRDCLVLQNLQNRPAGNTQSTLQKQYRAILELEQAIAQTKGLVENYHKLRYVLGSFESDALE